MNTDPQRMVKPLLDITALREGDRDVDERFRAAEARKREHMARRAVTAIEMYRSCWGVWIDHEDCEGRPALPAPQDVDETDSPPAPEDEANAGDASCVKCSTHLTASVRSSGRSPSPWASCSAGRVSRRLQSTNPRSG